MTFRLYGSLLLGIMLLFFAGCGKRVKTQDLGPDEYFEYAKKKLDDGDYLKASTEFTVIVLKFSGHPIVDDAQYFLAESHFKNKEYLIAISEYQKLVNDYPQSTYAVLGQFKIALSYQKLSLRAALDQGYTVDALRYFQRFVEEYADHELKPEAEKMIDQLNIKLARKKMIAAETYRRMGVCESAVIYHDIILEKYYSTPQASEALYWKGECLYKLKRYGESLSAFTLFVEKFPEHKFKNKARERLAELVDLESENQQSASSSNGSN